ncbi:NAD(P)-dependent oxidoreductase [Paludibacterium paludis]|uniref:3-beta hydroxysteroid dehydrogenase n=1 Tax=Paludibacterium paludis TaxID=1225769 RepID=A0A918NYA0_9NEIS|nr:NAD(P)-dependent oxidoreductase [Paludibacterium paludis]GGY06448.1 3-beta hydroxysteroid dehydrogenase [Paludibacterium paludis]
MNIALIGATGFVGSAILEELLSRGHRVTAIVTRPERVPVRDGVRALAADATDARTLAAALAGHDVVVSAFNPGWGKPDIRTLFVQGSRAILDAARIAGLRLIAVGGAGSLEIAPGVQLVDTPEFPAEWKDGALGAREALELFRAETAVDWAFVSPPVFLEPGERTGRYRMGKDQVLFGEDGPARISVADFAVAIADEAETPRHRRARFTVAEEVTVALCPLDGAC